MIDPDPVRWFDRLAPCSCGKPAHGVLRGPQNESYGAYCTKCAEARLARAKRERAQFASRAPL